jgi:hypothetical protein
VGNSEEKRPLGRPRRRWQDNIKMDLQEVRCGAMGWMELDLDRKCGNEYSGSIKCGNEPSGSIKCGNEPSGSIKCKEFLDWLRTD